MNNPQVSQTKSVPMRHWEEGFLYPATEWECYGYSEYGFDGIPRRAEIRRIRRTETTIPQDVQS